MLVYRRRSHIAWMLVVVIVVVRSVCCGRGWSEIEEPRLEHDVLWSRVDAETSRVGCEVDEDLVRGYLWDGEQDLELERGWGRDRGRDGAVDAQLVPEQISVWCLEVKLCAGSAQARASSGGLAPICRASCWPCSLRWSGHCARQGQALSRIYRLFGQPSGCHLTFRASGKRSSRHGLSTSRLGEVTTELASQSSHLWKVCIR